MRTTKTLAKIGMLLLALVGAGCSEELDEMTALDTDVTDVEKSTQALTAACTASSTAITTTYSAYNPTGSSPISYKITIYAPTQSGTYPIFLALPGTRHSAGAAQTIEAAKKMASRCFVAAEVTYAAGYKYSCGCDGNNSGLTPEGTENYACSAPYDKYVHKSKAIFDTSNANSAIRRIVSAMSTKVAKASYAEGVTIWGHSQGTWLARLGWPYALSNGANVIKAAYFTGAGVNSHWGCGYTGVRDVPCVKNGATGLIPKDRIRAFSGEEDSFYAPGDHDNTVCAQPPLLHINNVRLQLGSALGLCASGTTNNRCVFTSSVTGEQAGWRVVVNEDTPESGVARHPFQSQNPIRWSNSYSGEYTSLPWTLGKNLNWMARLTGPPAAENDVDK